MTSIKLLSCRACGKTWQLRRATCPACAAVNIEGIEASGLGVVWSSTTVFRAPTAEEDLPGGYGIALVDLREGARVMARGPAGLAIGERVRVAVGGRGVAVVERLANAPNITR